MIDNLKTIDDVYLLTPVDIGGNVILLNGTAFTMMERAGNEYDSFFNICVVKVAPRDSDIKVGQEILVHHFVSDQKVMIYGNVYLLAYTEQIIATKVKNEYEVGSDDYIKNFKSIKGHLAKPLKLEGELKSGISTSSFWQTKKAITFDGDTIEYVENTDYEIWYNEKLNLEMTEEFIFLINGEPTSYYVEVEVIKGLLWSEGAILIADKRNLIESSDGRFFLKKELLYGTADLN